MACRCGYCGSKDIETAILKSVLDGLPTMRSTWRFDEPTPGTTGPRISEGQRLYAYNQGSIPIGEALGMANKQWDFKPYKDG